ncbi:SDR family oxidoreductase [Ramlibacter rhizophilus]|uniref:SDR family oxidoreductase n=1 Tax=Ramlibacter rhizophilus TaxID=1781167 RepID=A0A4Z0BN45_9BURK|nr:SDR family oxidoreductase [Ramlibacter rhizophilus]TFY99484.1 SDR family oxidoreductase [Ramlibacter rhizophilus]
MATVLVIGASRGIGLEFARQYAAEGARVIATARSDDGLARLQAVGAQALRLDVTDASSVSGLGWQLDGEKLDVALYVAGVYSTDGATVPPAREAFDRVMHANVLGAMQLIPVVAPLVEAAQGRFGFISSQMGCIGTTRSSYGWVYRTSKAALNMVVAAAAHDYPRAVLLALSPGWVRTDMGGPSAPLDVSQSVSALRATLAAAGPAQRGAFLDYDGRRFESW